MKSLGFSSSGAGFADPGLGLTYETWESEFPRSNYFTEEIEKVMSGTLIVQTVFVHSDLFLMKKDGTGILLDNEGHILTNAHVVSHAFPFKVPGKGMALAPRWLAGNVLANFEGGEQCDAEVLSVDVGNDVALLKIPESVIKPHNIPCVLSKEVPGRGDKLFVVGYPRGRVPFVVKFGHVSHPSRDPSDIPENILNAFPHSLNHMDPAMKFLELDVEACPGFSGGPVSTVKGSVFGVLHAGIPGTACYGIPFAIIESALGRMFRRSPGDHVFCHLNEHP